MSNSYACFIVFFFVTSACTGRTGFESQDYTEYTMLLKVSDRHKLPRCKKKDSGVVYYIACTNELVYCDGKKYRPLDLDGEDGITWMVATIGANQEQCNYDGVVILSGPDINRDSKLDDEEIIDRQPICNGADGTDGQDG